MSQYTEADLAALTKSIRSGILEVDYPSGQRVRYQKLDDLLKLRGLIIRELNRLNGGGGPALAVLDGEY